MGILNKDGGEGGRSRERGKERGGGEIALVD